MCEKKKQYLEILLDRLVGVIKFIGERGQAFRGKVETIGDKQNGNFLGLLELFEKYDVFLREHLKTFAHKGSGCPSYL